MVMVYINSIKTKGPNFVSIFGL